MAQVLDRQAESLLYALRHPVEAAALAASDWIGRGSKQQGDAAAIAAMRAELDRLPVRGEVVIGEGEPGEIDHLFRGELLGAGGPEVDIAADPVEGTSYLAKGLTNAMAVLALAPRGAMFDPAPAFYMEKFAAPPAARGRIDPRWPVARRLAVLAEVLDRRVSDLTVFVLEKPRHRALVEAIHAAGARVALYPAGDVAGAVLAAIPGSGIDCLMGTGGTPEGMISACALRALGAAFHGRIDPQLQGEAWAVREAGLDTARWYAETELVRAQDVQFAATGITTGLLFTGVERRPDQDSMQTLLISGVTGERQLLTTTRPRPLADAAAEAAEEPRDAV